MGWKKQQEINEARAKAKKKREELDHIKKRKRHRSRPIPTSSPKDLRELVNRKVDQDKAGEYAKQRIKEKPKKAVAKKKVRT